MMSNDEQLESTLGGVKLIGVSVKCGILTRTRPRSAPGLRGSNKELGVTEAGDVK
ncbi:hypothetical protein GCM10007932_04130 [Vibrio penaeicida]|uniref:Uncharacterized protein n=1 Tax=Vibrio penaeicida TaxID=104609 RepID=A0AAV5NKG0_9VIBR|nr:hypothetical protein GCM10007932_04130 [Vibrio penaeicida]